MPTMSDAPAAPAPPVQPDPDRAVPARLDPAGTARIVRLLQTLFAYGRNLIETLRQEDYPQLLPWYPALTSIFGTSNPALITVYMIRGLLRLTALRARLRKGVSFPSLPVQQNQAPARIHRATGPGLRRPQIAGWTIPPGWPAGDHSLDHLPTPEEEMYAEIVAEDRNRPIGPILFDICVDLGIVPAQMDPITWNELRLAITLYGADPAPLEARSIDLADPAPAGAPGHVGRKSDAHSATCPSGPNGSPPVADQPTTVYPPWPPPPDHPPPSDGEWIREADRWAMGPGP